MAFWLLDSGPPAIRTRTSSRSFSPMTRLVGIGASSSSTQSEPLPVLAALSFSGSVSMVTLSIRMLCLGYQGSVSRSVGTSTLSFLCSALLSCPVIRVSSSTISSGIGLSQWLFCSPVLTGMPLLDSVCGRAGSEITGSFGFRAAAAGSGV